MKCQPKVGYKMYAEILSLRKTVRKFSKAIFTSGYMALLFKAASWRVQTLRLKWGPTKAGIKCDTDLCFPKKLGWKLYLFSQSEKKGGMGFQGALRIA